MLIDAFMSHCKPWLSQPVSELLRGFRAQVFKRGACSNHGRASKTLLLDAQRAGAETLLADLVLEPWTDLVRPPSTAAEVDRAFSRDVRREAQVAEKKYSVEVERLKRLVRTAIGEQAELERHRGELVDDLNDGKRGPINYHFYRGEE